MKSWIAFIVGILTVEFIWNLVQGEQINWGLVIGTIIAGFLGIVIGTIIRKSFS